MLRLSYRTLLAHKGRFVMTAFAVVMGVGFVVGSFVVTDTLRRSVDELFETVTTVDVTVRATTNLESGSGGPATRGRIPADLLDDVAAVDGVAVAGTSVFGYAQLLDAEGDPITTTGAPFLGVNWPEDDRLNPTTLDAGRAPERPGEVAIDRGTADDFGFEVGDRTQMLVIDGQVDVEIVGVVTYGETNSLLGARLMAMETAWADEILATEGQADSIDVVADPDVSPDELVTRIDAVLPAAGVEAVPSTQVVDEGQDQVSGFLSIFQNVLLAFAGIAVFVSAFYINNTFAIVLGQRVRELSLVRALGASGRQVVTSVIVEAVLVGLVAGALGIGFGLVIATALQAILAAGGFELPDRALVLSGRTLVAAMVVAVPVTVLSALPSARRAARVAPIEGMRSGVAPEGSTSRRRFVVGGVLAALGIVALGLGLFVLENTGDTFYALGVGAIAVFLGVSMLSPLIAAPVAWVLGWPFSRSRQPTGHLARANAMRSPDRTSRTAAALMIGLALVTTALVVGESMKQSFADAVSNAVTADFVVSDSSFTGFSPALAEDLRALPEIDAVTGVRFNRFAFEGSETDVVAVDPATAGAVIDIDLQSGAIEDLDADSILIHEDPAEELGLVVGDTVEVIYASGEPQEVTVVGIYADATFAGNYLMDLATYNERYPANNLDLFVFATVADGVDADAARPAIEAALEDYPQVTLESREEFNESQQAQLDQVLLAVNGLLGLALLIALLGIANTLALSVVERTHEIGLLRAVGQSRRQTRRMVLIEALIVSGFGAVLGLAIGLAFGVGAVSAMPPSIVTGVTVPVGSLIAVLVLATVFGIVAGALPARRAARLDVLHAISVE